VGIFLLYGCLLSPVSLSHKEECRPRDEADFLFCTRGKVAGFGVVGMLFSEAIGCAAREAYCVAHRSGCEMIGRDNLDRSQSQL